MAVRCDQLRIARGGFELTANWALEPGSTLALIGPSGAGKSMFLSALAGFETELTGRVFLGGQEVTALPPAARPLSLMFQDHNLFAHLSVADNVGLGLRPDLRLDAAERVAVAQALEKVGLSGLEERLPKDLSGGQQSRAALARALIRKRPVLALDEPFAALGPAMRREMFDLVADIRQAHDLTVLFVTHDPAEAQRAPLTAFVDGGVVGAPMATAELFADPPQGLRDYL